MSKPATIGYKPPPWSDRVGVTAVSLVNLVAIKDFAAISKILMAELFGGCATRYIPPFDLDATGPYFTPMWEFPQFETTLIQALHQLEEAAHTHAETLRHYEDSIPDSTLTDAPQHNPLLVGRGHFLPRPTALTSQALGRGDYAVH